MRHAAHPHLFFHQGVIERELLQTPLAKTVASAIADVEHPNVVFLCGERNRAVWYSFRLQAAIALGVERKWWPYWRVHDGLLGYVGEGCEAGWLRSESRRSTSSTASELATSPAAAPPMLSHTT